MKSLSDYRIVYMGTPKISAQILEKMIEDGFNIVAVIAQEDKPVGRKGVLEPVPTKQVALAHNVPVYQPHRIRKEYEFVEGLKPDLILTMAYGQIVPHELLIIPKLGCLNLHGSLLPKLRGAAPIQRAILNGDTVTGVTLMEMVDEMDAGKMFAKEACEITDEDTTTSLQQKIVECAVKLVEEKLPLYLNGKLSGEEQDPKEVTFADKIQPEDEKVSFKLGTHEFIRYVHALSEEPGAYVYLDDLKLKLFRVHFVNNETNNPVGTLLIVKGTYIQLKDGVIQVDEIQLEGKKKMDGKSFANGSQKLHQKILK